MDRLANTTPLRIVEYIIALTTVLGGLVLLTPLVLIPVPGVGDPEIVSLLLSRPGIIAVAIFAIASGLLHAYGLKKRLMKWRANGLFLNALTRMYALIITWLPGTVPAVMPWESSFATLLIIIALWLYHQLTPEVDD